MTHPTIEAELIAALAPPTAAERVEARKWTRREAQLCARCGQRHVLSKPC